MYVNSGNFRCKTIQVAKTSGGVGLIDYPKSYSILWAFTSGSFSFPLITAIAFEQMPDAEYIQRLGAFKTYINSVEGVVVDESTELGYEAFGINTIMCPIGE